MKKIIIYITLIIIFLGISHTASAEITVKDMAVTDITPNSFSVVWISSVAARPDLLVFDGPDCTIAAGNLNIVSQPVSNGDFNISTSAEDIGVMKVRVTGLKPDTQYCFQTVTKAKGNSEQVISPLTPKLLTTEHQVIKNIAEEGKIVPIANDQLLIPVYKPDQGSSADGAILLVSFAKGDSPVTGFVGDGAEKPYGLADLNNLFNSQTRENLSLSGGEVILISEYRGSYGCTLKKYRKVPLNNKKSEMKSAEGCFMREDIDCDDLIDISDIRKELKGNGTGVGDSCFNPDYDQNSDTLVDALDINIVIDKYGTVK